MQVSRKQQIQSFALCIIPRSVMKSLSSHSGPAQDVSHPPSAASMLGVLPSCEALDSHLSS